MMLTGWKTIGSGAAITMRIGITTDLTSAYTFGTNHRRVKSALMLPYIDVK